MTLSFKYREFVPMGWARRAACRGMAADLFFGPSDDGDPDRKVLRTDPSEDRRIRRAVAVCYRCPVRRTCLNHAMHYPEPVGIWGGLTALQRNRLRTRL